LNGRLIVSQLQKARDIRDRRDTKDINQESLVYLLSQVYQAFLARLCDCASYAPASIFSRKA